MKLRNKKTGEIRKAEAREDGIYLYDETTEQWYKYELELLADWWEYYEEPKEYWWIKYDGTISHAEIGTMSFTKQERIGNYFRTKEEAEKAVRKLKAWKRLKDKGFEFVEHQIHGMTIDGEGSGCAYFKFDKPLSKSDLDLLFGGEE